MTITAASALYDVSHTESTPKRGTCGLMRVHGAYERPVLSNEIRISNIGGLLVSSCSESRTRLIEPGTRWRR